MEIKTVHDTKTLEKIATLYETVFHPAQDPRQIPASVDILETIAKNGTVFAAIEEGEVIGYFFGFHSTKKAMKDFLAAKIEEKDLFTIAKETPLEKGDTFYLSTCYVDPAKQGKGIGGKLTQALLEKPIREKKKIFVWVGSEAGNRLMSSVEKIVGPIEKRYEQL